MLAFGLFLRFMQKFNAHKDNSGGGEKMKQELKNVSCDPVCGFSITSHDEKELKAIVMTHAKKTHHMDMTGREVEGMMKMVA